MSYVAKILAVDDEPELTELMHFHLVRAGHDVVTAANGWEAIASVKERRPDIILDGAHNPAGAWALRSALSAQYEDRPLIFVFGAMRDKAISEMAQILFPLAERVIAVQAENPRSASPEEIREAAKRSSTEIETAENVASALDRARALSKLETVVVITGSIYVVGEAMRSLGAKV